MNLTPDAGVQPSDAEIIKIAETLGKHEPGVSNYDSWGPLGYRLDENGEYTIPVVPGNVLPFARALISRFGTRPAAEPTQGGSAGEAIAHVVADPDGSNKRVAFYSNRALWETPLWTKLYALSARSPEAQGEYTYASKQETQCAGCGKRKHTPLRIDAMGGYVCLTCIDQKMGSLLGEFGEDDTEAASDIVAWLRANTNEFGAAERIEARFAPAPAEPAPLTPEEHQVLRSAVRDSAEVVAPGRMEEPAHPAWCSCGACDPETAKTGRELDLYDEIECDLPYLFGRASLEGHESGQRLAKAVREKMQRARLSTPPTQEAEPAQQDTGDEDLALDLLATVFDAYENGAQCFEDPEDCADFVGYAVKLDDETFKACCDLLNRRRPATPPAEKQAAPTWTPEQVQQIEQEAESMLGKLQASPQAPSGESEHA